MFSKVEFSTYLEVLFIIQNGKKVNNLKPYENLFTLRLANMLQIYSTISWWIFGLIKACFLSAQTNTFFFYFTTTTFFNSLFFSFHSFPLSPCCNQDIRVSKPIKSQMKVKYANANINHFKMFAGRIKMQQFLWQKKKGWSVPSAKLIHHQLFL